MEHAQHGNDININRVEHIDAPRAVLALVRGVVIGCVLAYSPDLVHGHRYIFVCK